MHGIRALLAALGGACLTVAVGAVGLGNALRPKDATLSATNGFLLVAYAFGFAALVLFVAGIVVPRRVMHHFPNIKIEVTGVGFHSVDYEPTPGIGMTAQLADVALRFTSKESDRAASLSIRLYRKLSPEGLADFGAGPDELPLTPFLWLGAPPPAVRLPTLSMPSPLPAQRAVSGWVSFEIPPYWDAHFARDNLGRIEIEDHVSGSRVSVPAHMGTWDRKTWNEIRAK